MRSTVFVALSLFVLCSSQVASQCFRGSTGAGSYIATLRQALLADSWTVLRAGIGPLRDSWQRYQRANLILLSTVAATLSVIQRRLGHVRAMTDEEKACSCWLLLDSMDVDVPILSESSPPMSSCQRLRPLQHRHQGKQAANVTNMDETFFFLS